MAALLAENGVNALAYHAGMDKDAREANQNRFMTEPAVVMVATIAFGMGIDKSDVRFVFHTDLPGSLEAYYQEIGRAGRDGVPAEAHMLFGLEDIRMRRVFIDQEDAGEDRKRREHARLNMLLAYCEASRCRRQLLLQYFGEASEPCGNCDACLEPRERIDSTEDARKVLAAVMRDRRAFRRCAHRRCPARQSHGAHGRYACRPCGVRYGRRTQEGRVAGADPADGGLRDCCVTTCRAMAGWRSQSKATPLLRGEGDISKAGPSSRAPSQNAKPARNALRSSRKTTES